MADLRQKISLIERAASLADDDVLVVLKPNAYNPIIAPATGVNRTVTLGDIKNYVRDEMRKERIGKYTFWSYVPSLLELAEQRELVLEGGIYEIALYQDLCDKKWVGPTKNATAPWWYKCDADGTRNVNGLWMRVEDARGMFFRIAGQNSIFKCANNTPYDGKSVGEFSPDTTREFNLFFDNGGSENINILQFFENAGWDSNSVNRWFQVASGKGAFNTTVFLRANGNFGNETAGASISFFVTTPY